MKDLKQYEAWFITGSQHLYGEQALQQVADDAKEIAAQLDLVEDIPVRIVFKPVVKSSEEIFSLLQQANTSSACIGVITWMHTFSPAKMWIRGLAILQKPLLHLHTQHHRDIPWDRIDMDFMNLHQSAHGDREFGFINSRMRLERKVVAGHWKEPGVARQIGVWCRAACGWHDLQGARFARFGDNMREVAVTEGDKVEAELKFGFSVNTYGVGALVERIRAVEAAEADRLLSEYEESYRLVPELKKNGERRNSLLQEARVECALRQFLEEGNFKGFTNTFEDLYGMDQLPGLAIQRLMAEGYGFGAEGDWKTAALVRAMKVMGTGLPGGNAFMEDYTYHFNPESPLVLGSHMLEVDASLAAGKPSCEIHPLGIGGKSDPVRLVFNVSGGPALNASLVDMGNRFRLLVNTVQAVEPENELPKLPVARVMWRPAPDMQTACAAWIYAGGAHHTCFSQNLSSEHLEDFAAIAGVELIRIDEGTELHRLRNELRWSDASYAGFSRR